jgi:hypothetical protein
MATWSMVFTDTVSNPAPPGAPFLQVGDGRPYTAAEWRTFWKYIFARGGAGRGVLKGVLNECAVTVIGANDLQVDTGLILCDGGVVVIETHEHLAPVNAGAGLTRQDSVICELDLNGSGSTEQYTVRVVLKQGTAGAPPAMTQTAVLWQIRLYDYTVNDAGAVSVLTDQRQYLRMASEFDHGELLGLADDDHSQYYNAARHTKAVHDALGVDAATVGGFTAAQLMGGIAIGFSGATVLFGGVLGGSDGHRPIDPITAGAHEDWHWANGETVAGVTTLDSRGKVVLGSDGAAGTYPVDSTGGAATANLAHTHAAGSFAAASHTHGATGLTTNNSGANHTHTVIGNTGAGGQAHTHDFTAVVSIAGSHLHSTSYATVQAGGGVSVMSSISAIGNHIHLVGGTTGNGSADHSHAFGATSATGSADHTHAVNGATAATAPAIGGASDTSLSATQSVMNPFRSWYLITYVG